MTKRLQAKKKISRKLGASLWGQDKDPFLKRNTKPGQHGANTRRRTTDYGLQLKAKQKLKFYYGNISEKQFRTLFKAATKIRGDASENFIGLLERRLDTAIYRANIVPTVFAARQFVNHKHILVNGKVVNIPSYRLKPDDVVEVRDRSKQLNIVLESIEKKSRDIPTYLEVDAEKRSVKYLSVPSFADVPYDTEMEPHLIVEFYSR
jgi:small subunit ribosomal protein S4